MGKAEEQRREKTFRATADRIVAAVQVGDEQEARRVTAVLGQLIAEEVELTRQLNRHRAGRMGADTKKMVPLPPLLVGQVASITSIGRQSVLWLAYHCHRRGLQQPYRPSREHRRKSVPVIFPEPILPSFPGGSSASGSDHFAA